ncbi:MFS transporter [Reinekea blandensis]|nr:MFS transporter [Reinekea blandensis]
MTLLKKPRVHRYLAGRATDMLSASLFTLALSWKMLEGGVSGTVVALLALVCTVSSTLLTPFASTWMDRYSRRQILVQVKLVSTASAVSLILLPESHTLTIPAMMVVQWVYWVCNDLSWTCGNAFVQENYRADEYAPLSSLQEMILQGFTLLSGALGLWFLSVWRLDQFAWFAVITGSVSALLYQLTPYRMQPRDLNQESFAQSLRSTADIFRARREFFLFVALSCLSYPMLTYLAKLVPVYLSEGSYGGGWLASWNLGYGLGALLCGAGIAVLLRRFNLKTLMQSTLLGLSVLLFVMGAVLRPETLVVGALLIGLLNPIARIARANLLHHEVPVAQRGRIEGGLKIFSTVLQSISYLLIAGLAAIDRIEWGFTLFAGVLMAFYLAMVWVRWRMSSDSTANALL